MQLIVFIISYPLILLISLLPFRLLYLLSDVIYLVVYHLLGYRKQVVRENIALVFPTYSLKARLEIERKSYKHMCDMFLEMVKTMSISKEEMEKRFVFKNWEVYGDLEKKGKSIALMAAHYASYEWGILMNTKIKTEAFGIYKKVNNPYFDKLVRKIRSNFKTNLIHTRESIAVIEQNYNENKKCLYGFVSDQSPQVKPNTHWSKFMGMKVPVYTGAEILSKKFDMNMIYFKVKRVKRGFYEAEFEVLSTNVQTVPDFEITELFLRKVEQQIIEAPEFYLWTHRRWKHRDKNNV